MAEVEEAEGDQARVGHDQEAEGAGNVEPTGTGSPPRPPAAPSVGRRERGRCSAGHRTTDRRPRPRRRPRAVNHMGSFHGTEPARGAVSVRPFAVIAVLGVHSVLIPQAMYSRPGWSLDTDIQVKGEIERGMAGPRPHHRNHRAGRLVPGRAAARQGLRGRRRGAPHQHTELRAHRSPPRTHHARRRRPHRSDVAGERGQRAPADRGVQPGARSFVQKSFASRW